MAARCAAAGRQNNEDNFQLSDNLADDQWGFVTGKEVDLGEKGALLVVCDGMGGMNAGATASDLAVKTAKEWFSNDRLTPQVTASPDTMLLYVEQVIIAADNKIKETGNQNPEQTGMGSTIVLAWLFETNVYVGWCGDSRAYRYNAASGLERLSHDHSYVQELVDSGKLSKELAFDHPDTNIITRSLGDVRQQVKPDVKHFALMDGDVLLLCTDGLHGVLRDVEIESIIANNTDTLENCRNALWTESQQAGWTDNVTIALCQVISGAGTVEKPAPETPAIETAKPIIIKRKSSGILTIILTLLLGVAGFVGYMAVTRGWFAKPLDQQDTPIAPANEADSTKLVNETSYTLLISPEQQNTSYEPSTGYTF